MSLRLIVAAVVIFFVGAVIALGLRVAGSPSDARARRFDEQRLNDLRSIAGAVSAYHASRKQLPPSLAEITAWPDHPVTLRDPENNSPYTYQALDAGAYDLCATFARASADEPATPAGFWVHPAGRHCFRVMVE